MTSNDKTSLMQYSIVCLWNSVYLQMNMGRGSAYRNMNFTGGEKRLNTSCVGVVATCWTDGRIVWLFWSCCRTKVSFWLNRVLIVTLLFFLILLRIRFLHYTFQTRHNYVLFKLKMLPWNHISQTMRSDFFQVVLLVRTNGTFKPQTLFFIKHRAAFIICCD